MERGRTHGSICSRSERLERKNRSHVDFDEGWPVGGERLGHLLAELGPRLCQSGVHSVAEGKGEEVDAGNVQLRSVQGGEFGSEPSSTPYVPLFRMMNTMGTRC